MKVACKFWSVLFLLCGSFNKGLYFKNSTYRCSLVLLLAKETLDTLILIISSYVGPQLLWLAVWLEACFTHNYQRLWLC